ncbi:hypothetical protein LPU83_pLPU83d_0931 (plasmid) [Rhizobium favelukesii]|uniref:Uncharacterized protein n=1 Tax=Rhizobium favelukesii TaxID=348824 RepID=W6S7Z0_9HYPH|nr:hypothetical protein LPU83_pLPU83d_0931 [Rhizobium favelukesii]
MNARQELSLPDEMDVSVFHPDRDSGRPDEFIDREELRTLTEAWIDSVGIRSPAPISEDAVDRLNEAKAARTVLEEIIASASEAGWGTREITVALIEAAQSLTDANRADPEPAGDPDGEDAVREQIGHGEQFD